MNFVQFVKANKMSKLNPHYLSLKFKIIVWKQLLGSLKLNKNDLIMS
jgi:hypothetical protein